MAGKDKYTANMRFAWKILQWKGSRADFYLMQLLSYSRTSPSGCTVIRYLWKIPRVNDRVGQEWPSSIPFLLFFIVIWLSGATMCQSDIVWQLHQIHRSTGVCKEKICASFSPFNLPWGLHGLFLVFNLLLSLPVQITLIKHHTVECMTCQVAG